MRPASISTWWTPAGTFRVSPAAVLGSAQPGIALLTGELMGDCFRARYCPMPIRR